VILFDQKKPCSLLGDQEVDCNDRIVWWIWFNIYRGYESIHHDASLDLLNEKILYNLYHILNHYNLFAAVAMRDKPMNDGILLN
jgi:fructosamine-3-kinase